MAISNYASLEIIWGLGGPEEDHQLHHCCWIGRVGEREGEEPCLCDRRIMTICKTSYQKTTGKYNECAFSTSYVTMLPLLVQC